MEETWVEINGLGGYYLLSSLGRIKAMRREIYRGSTKYFIKEKMLKIYHGLNGYFYVDIRIDKVRHRYLLHRLLADHFIPNPENKREVNHIDNNPANYSLSNLEWVTPSENMKHMVKSGRSKIHLAVAVSRLKLRKPVRQLTMDRVFVAEYDSVTDAAKAIGVKTGSICPPLKEPHRHCRGFKWEYVK